MCAPDFPWSALLSKDRRRAIPLFRFHLLKPEYVHHRIKELQRSFRLRLLVCHIDVEDVVEPLGQVIKAALLNDVTLICGWSPEVLLLCALCFLKSRSFCTHVWLPSCGDASLHPHLCCTIC